MDKDKSLDFPSYESFASDLRNGNEMSSPKVANSTMVAAKEADGYSASTHEPVVLTKRKVIKLPLPFRCQECQKEYKKVEDLRIHLLRHLIGRKPEASSQRMTGTGEPPYFCRQHDCKRFFENRQERRDHETRHISSNNFNCER